MNEKELQEIIKNHNLWLNDNGGERADFSGADLRWANLKGANLRWANLKGANLSGANLSGVNLSGVNLRWADLSGVNLSGVNLSGVNLSGVNLSGADLRWADLSGANLSGTDLRWADLSGANLSGVNLNGANLSGTDLSGANLNGTDLNGANLNGANLSGVIYDENTGFFAIQCPEEGSFIAWKKCQDNVLVKLLIPEDAKRSSATSRKCRASKAVVLDVIGADVGVSYYDANFIYEKGKEVISNGFDEDRWKECSNGIHFFITKKEAENF